MNPLTWVVGAGGLLGRHVSAALASRGRTPTVASIPWHDAASARETLRQEGVRLAEHANRAGTPWQVFWCAGVGVTSTGKEALDDELAAFSSALDGLAEVAGSRGTLFVASSVGGVYAGNPNPPFTEASAVAPLAAYGYAKLEMEELARAWANRTGNSLAIGRISNLYGAGQNLAKAQGLISQLCANYVRRRPSSIWVPLDTVRDYIHAEDCAHLVVDLVDRAAQGGSTVLKILASGQGVTISGLLGEFRRVLGRRPEILIGSSSTSAFQALDLSVKSTVWPDLDHRRMTPLAVGIERTIAGLQLAWARSGGDA